MGAKPDAVFHGAPYQVAELSCDDSRWECSCGTSGSTLATLHPVDKCALTAGERSPAGRCPQCDSLVYPRARNWTMNVPVISTGHVSPKTRAWLDHISEEMVLDPQRLQTSLLLIVAPYDAGWFMRSFEGRREMLPVDLAAVLAWAKKKGYDWIRLDADGDYVDGLNVFDEECAHA